MADNKTKATDASVEDYISSRARGRQRPDCEAIRGRDLVVYLVDEGERRKSQLSRLGKHR